MDLKSEKKTVGEVFKSGFYQIPRFQRPYSWKKETVEEFWNDIVQAESEYFIGSLVTYPVGDTAKEKFGLVDGQQRITTLTIIFCLLRDIAKDFGFDDFALGTHSLIERVDIENKRKFVIYSETSLPFLQSQILDTEKGNEEPLKAEEKNLQVAKYTLQALLKDYIEGKTGGNLLSKLKEIREILLRLNVISITAGTVDDAYIIFETLNSRGENLQLKDLVKSHLTRLWKTENEEIDRCSIAWQTTTSEFSEMEEKDAKIIDQFLHHQWLSTQEYSTEKELFHKLKIKIKSEKQTRDYLEELKFDSKIYKVIKKPSQAIWKNEELELRNSLIALTEIFNIKQPIPLLLSLLRAYRLKLISLKQARLSFRVVENFHFQHSAIASNRSSGGLSFLYAKTARDLYEAKSSDKAQQVLTTMARKLSLKGITFVEFNEAFKGLNYSKNSTEKKLISYVLKKFHVCVCGEGLNAEDITVEHIKPQSDKNDYTDSIGNLLVTSQKTNNKLGNKDFLKKRQVIDKQPDTCMDIIIDKSTKWEKPEIEERSNYMSKVGFEKIWKV